MSLFEMLMSAMTQVAHDKRGVTHRKTLHIKTRLTYTKTKQAHNDNIIQQYLAYNPGQTMMGQFS